MHARGFASRISSFFTFVNFIWFVSIVGLTALAIPFLAVVLGPSGTIVQRLLEFGDSAFSFIHARGLRAVVLPCGHLHVR